jgi:hypothetical protein
MRPGDSGQFSISQMMLCIGGIALAMGVVLSRSSLQWASVGAGLVGLSVLGFLGGSTVLDAFLGVRCPGCGARTMGRTLVVSFRDRYFRCASCGLRARRGVLQGWEDASAPDFDRFYDHRRPENPWTQPPGLEDEDLIYSKTHGNLLLNKQRRHPNPPDQEART